MPTPLTELLALLDRADFLPGAAALRSRTYDLLELTPGARVADVGCGAGRAAAELAARGADAVGLDPSTQMLDAGRERYPWLDLREAAAEDLPFADGELAGYRADKVFHTLTDPGAAAREAYRVLAPGGRIVLVGQDWEAIVVDSDEPDLTRTIIRARAATMASPRIARGYRNLLLDAGFADAHTAVVTAVHTGPEMLPVVHNLATGAAAAGGVTEDERDRWCAEQSRRAETDRMFLALPMFVASARK